MAKKEPIPYGPRLLDHVPERFRSAAIGFVAARTDSCLRITRKMSDSLERRLSAREKFAIWWHSLVCQACVRYLEQIKILRNAVRKDSPQAAGTTPSLSSEAKHRIEMEIRDHNNS